jgi:hypothetical protein
MVRRRSKFYRKAPQKFQQFQNLVGGSERAFEIFPRKRGQFLSWLLDASALQVAEVVQNRLAQRSKELSNEGPCVGFIKDGICEVCCGSLGVHGHRRPPETSGHTKAGRDRHLRDRSACHETAYMAPQLLQSSAALASTTETLGTNASMVGSPSLRRDLTRIFRGFS